MTIKQLLLTAIGLLLLIPSASKADDGNSVHLFVAPVGFVIGIQQYGAEFRVTDNLTIGPEVYLQNFKKDAIFVEDRSKTTGYGARINWQFGGPAIGTGWIISLLALTMPKYEITRAFGITASTNPGVTLKAETSNFQAVLTGGYRWVWGWFSLKLSAGAGYNTVPTHVNMRSDDGTATSNNVETSDFGFKNGTSFRGELLLGAAF